MRNCGSLPAHLPPWSSVDNAARFSLLCQCLLYLRVHERAKRQVLGRRNRCESNTCARDRCAAHDDRLGSAPGSSRPLPAPESRRRKLIRSLSTLLGMYDRDPAQQHVETLPGIVQARAQLQLPCRPPTGVQYCSQLGPPPRSPAPGFCHWVLYPWVRERAKHQGLGHRNRCESLTPARTWFTCRTHDEHAPPASVSVLAPPASRSDLS
jgi:hypothetical protein